MTATASPDASAPPPAPADRSGPATPAHPLAGRRVLVTGAAGFIGVHLCRRLAAEGIEVHAVSRSFAAGTPGPGLPGHDDPGTTAARARIHRLGADLAEPGVAARVLRDTGADVVFHLAGLAAGARDASLVLPTLRANTVSTVELLTAALDTGPRIVIPGSLEEPTEPGAVASSPYAMSKWAASGYGRMFAALYGLPVAIGRTFITYGPTAKDVNKLLPYVILSLLDGQAPKLASGKREVDWIHVDDVVDGLVALAVSPGAAGATLDIGSGTLVSIRALVEQAVAVLQPAVQPQFGALPERPMEQVRVADVDATFAATGWRPRIGLAQGLAATVDWFRTHREALRPR